MLQNSLLIRYSHCYQWSILRIKNYVTLVSMIELNLLKVNFGETYYMNTALIQLIRLRQHFRTEKQFTFGSGSGVMMLVIFVGKTKRRGGEWYYAAIALTEKSKQKQTSCKLNPRFIVSLLCNFSPQS